jgi:pyrroline-5-carboxylate reductase
MTPASVPVLLVGCGKMGGALLKGWIAQGHAGITVVEPGAAARKWAESEFEVATYADAAEIPEDYKPAAVVLAVKPQAMDKIAPGHRGYADAVYLSIAAGTTIATLRGHLGDVAVVRAMPNLPASIGLGMTVACAGPKVSAAARALCQNLLAAVGAVAWVSDESVMDAVTAVSGSGPAYVFLLAECLADAGVSAGLDAKLAGQLARATVIGSGELLKRSGESPAKLREQVTSPGGTTEAALSVLTGGEALRGLVTRAVAAALKRSRELSGQKT